MQIHWLGSDEFDPETRERVEARLEKLASGHTDLIDLRITGRRTRHHHHGDQEVRITCQARGQEIVAGRTRADLDVALREALDAFEREVHRLRDKRRDLGRVESRPQLGIVDTLIRDEGYGFIVTDAGERVYFHRSAVERGLFERLDENDRVALDVEEGPQGPRATTVIAPPPGVAPAG